jgi:aldehyde dehydrogenase family 7 protein A1
VSTTTLQVFGWNLAVSLVCGNVHIWKGASTTSLVTIATMRIIAGVLEANNLPSGPCVCVAVRGGRERSVGCCRLSS